MISSFIFSARAARASLASLALLMAGENPTAQAGEAARIAPPPVTYQFPEGSNFTYAVEWHFFTAGAATIHVESTATEKHVVATAESASVVSLLYTVRDQFQSAVDPKTFCSLRLTKHAEEGSHKRQTEIRFDYARLKSVLEEKNLKTNATKTVENDIPACVTDVLSGFYYVGSLPLAAGNLYLFPINDGGKTANVRAEVEGKEAVKIPAGSYATTRVRLEATSGPLQGKGALWIWYADDERHTPVQMRAKMNWGTLMFRLQKIEKR